MSRRNQQPDKALEAPPFRVGSPQFTDSFDGLFVGGSISWKFSTARMWADLAHLHKKKCHAGRVGTWEGFIHMHYSGVDSVDTTTASRHQDDSHIRKYLSHLKNQKSLPE